MGHVNEPMEDPVSIYLKCLLATKGIEGGVDSMLVLMRKIEELSKEEQARERQAKEVQMRYEQPEELPETMSAEEIQEQGGGLWKRMMKVRRGSSSCPCGPFQW